MQIMPGEKRTVHNGRTSHLDCAVDFEHEEDRAEERRRG
jgi:hypothetical protein